MNSHTQKSLELLTRLLGASEKPNSRSLELLKPWDVDGAIGWQFHILQAFNSALDIRQTLIQASGRSNLQWTQGANFAFKAGFTVYDTPRAYLPWDEAMKHIGVCIQISEAADVAPKSRDSVRYPGFVKASVFRPNPGRTKLTEESAFTWSQDDFVKVLIAGIPD